MMVLWHTLNIWNVEQTEGWVRRGGNPAPATTKNAANPMVGGVLLSCAPSGLHRLCRSCPWAWCRSWAAWSERREGVVEELYVRAVSANPHAHLDPGDTGPCPECSCLAAASFIDFGLFKLAPNCTGSPEGFDLDGAEQLLRAAERFAPRNPHAAANLGALLARRAQRIAAPPGKVVALTRLRRALSGRRAQQEWDEVSMLLCEAARLQQKAADLRPDFEPYRRRVAEFTAAAANPRDWTLAP